jgi:hypothetical protein
MRDIQIVTTESPDLLKTEFDMDYMMGTSYHVAPRGYSFGDVSDLVATNLNYFEAEVLGKIVNGTIKLK